MKIIISPAKKMRVDTDHLPVQDLPIFLSNAEELQQKLREMSPEELKKLWKCNDQIAALNIERLHTLDLRKHLTPAILAYEGIQYQYMAPSVFTARAYAYIQEHLRILSGLYGILRPFDGIIPYRLEMQAKLKICNGNNLYNYWNTAIAEELFSETNSILNLASKEYSQCISKFLHPGIRFVTCIFGENIGGKIVEKGTMCKMARGEMVRFMAEQEIEYLEEVQTFDRLGYVFDPLHSDESTYKFVKADAISD